MSTLTHPIRVREIPNGLRIKPRIRVFAASSIGWTLKDSQFRLGVNNRGTTKDGGEHLTNPIRKRCNIVHGVLPEGRHLGLRTEDTVEELAHDDEEWHEGGGDH